jgi:hypothetical protein
MFCEFPEKILIKQQICKVCPVSQIVNHEELRPGQTLLHLCLPLGIQGVMVNHQPVYAADTFLPQGM